MIFFKLKVKRFLASKFKDNLADSKKMNKTMIIMVDLLRKKNILHKDQKTKWERSLMTWLRKDIFYAHASTKCSSQ